MTPEPRDLSIRSRFIFGNDLPKKFRKKGSTNNGGICLLTALLVNIFTTAGAACLTRGANE